jgi:hypothetical protein
MSSAFILGPVSMAVNSTCISWYEALLTYVRMNNHNPFFRFLGYDTLWELRSGD